jgi:hypothetical protein
MRVKGKKMFRRYSVRVKVKKVLEGTQPGSDKIMRFGPRKS